VPAPSEFVGCGEDALLQVVERLIASSSLAGPGIASSGLGSPGRGLLHEGIPRRGWPRRGAGQQFSEMAGLGHP